MTVIMTSNAVATWSVVKGYVGGSVFHQYMVQYALRLWYYKLWDRQDFANDSRIDLYMKDIDYSYKGKPAWK